MASLFKPTYTAVDPKTGAKVQRRARKWYGQYRDAAGKLRRVPLSANKSAAQLMLADLVRGVAEPTRPADRRKRPLAELASEWESAMENRGVSPKQVQLCLYRLRRLVTVCGWQTLADLENGAALAVERHLATWQRGEERMSARTRNGYVAACRAFGRHVGSEAFAPLRQAGTAADRRRERRPLSEAELGQLLRAALDSPADFAGLSGRDRHALYLTACVTGYRAGELAALTPASFALSESPAVIRLGGQHTKNGRPARQPVPAELVPTLAAYLAARPTHTPVWPGSWPHDGAEMLRADLTAAGIPYTVEGPDGPLYADFHALRHSYIKLLDRPGITLKQQMELSRHSDPRLTMKVYGRAQLAELGAAAALACTALARANGLVEGCSVRNEEVGATPTLPGGQVGTAPEVVGQDGVADSGIGENGGGIQYRTAARDLPGADLPLALLLALIAPESMEPIRKGA